MSVGRHRPFIYDGLHFVQTPPKHGVVHAVIVSVLAIIFALLVIVDVLFFIHSMGIPVKWTGTENPLISYLGLQ